MAYNSQRTDFASRVTNSTKKMLEAISELKQEVAYNGTQNLLDSNYTSQEVFNGITGGELQGVLDAVTALDSYLANGQHYAVLNKVR